MHVCNVCVTFTMSMVCVKGVQYKWNHWRITTHHLNTLSFMLSGENGEDYESDDEEDDEEEEVSNLCVYLVRCSPGYSHVMSRCFSIVI